MVIPTLTTSRLILRPFIEADAEPLHRILNEDGILRYFPRPDPPDMARVQRIIAGQLRHWEEHGLGWWAVELHSTSELRSTGELRATGELLGWSGLQYLPETKEVEVGYLLSRTTLGPRVSRRRARWPRCGSASRRWSWAASSALCIQRTSLRNGFWRRPA